MYDLCIVYIGHDMYMVGIGRAGVIVCICGTVCISCTDRAV